jgi:hypothetical protein
MVTPGGSEGISPWEFDLLISLFRVEKRYSEMAGGQMQFSGARARGFIELRAVLSAGVRRGACRYGRAGARSFPMILFPELPGFAQWSDGREREFKGTCAFFAVPRARGVKLNF